MDDSKLKEFLRDYIKILQENIDITSQLPLQMTVNMPAGVIEITTSSGKQVAYITYDDGGGPSMPVGPTAVTFATLFVELINKYSKLLEKNNE